jgi:hypothetical protein
MSITTPVMLAMLLRVRRRVIVVGTGRAEKRAAEAKKREKLDLRETGFEAIQHCHVAFLETNDRMKQKMVTRFYSVEVNVWVARPACPPVCGSRM